MMARRFVTEGTMSPTTGENDHWGTPQALYDALDREFGFKVDVCASEENHKHDVYITKEQDALTVDWTSFGGPCFMNPPYGTAIVPFVEKAVETMEAGGTVVGVLPGRIDTRWFDSVWKAAEIRCIRGRLRYGDGRESAPFPSVVAVWRPHTGPAVWKRIDREGNYGPLEGEE